MVRFRLGLVFRIRFWTVLDGFGRFLGRSATVLQPLNSRGSAQHPGAYYYDIL